MRQFSRFLTVAVSPGSGGAVQLDAQNLHAATCVVCRRTARRWLGRGTVHRCEGLIAQWRADADAQGDSVLWCPGCDGILYFEPVRTEGGAVQWASTAFRSCNRGTQAAVVAAVVVLVVLVLGGSAQAQETSPEPSPAGSPAASPAASPGVSPAASPAASPAPSPAASPAASPAPSASPAPVVLAPTVVQLDGVSGDALLLLTGVAALSLATSAAALVSGWHR